MSETVSIDLSPIIRAVNSLEHKIAGVTNEVEDTKRMVATSLEELRDLREEFETMVREQRAAAALQRAITEIVRIRQELDKKFGNHQKVRDNMLGILQASDLSLVKEKTISQCSEELMLACPRYWLAPCLIAVTAWMANDKALAERALAEAIKRNDECTSLVMALISRRAGKVTASFIWLQRYFNMQNPNNMKESILAYIDAYANGIFGEDKEDRCTQSVDRWMAELNENSDFKGQQISKWKARFDAMKEKQLNGVVALSADGVCEEYGAIYDFVSRIRCRARITKAFDNILSKHVDRKKLIEAIDDNLETLVKQYEEEEAPLRKEEREMSLIKEHKGNEAKVQAILDAEFVEDGHVNLADRLSNAIVDSSTPASIRKTSVRLMSNYIKQSYKEYVNEKAEFYPEEITLNIGGAKMKTRNGENMSQMKSAVEAKNSEFCKNDLAKVKPIAAIAFAVLAVVMFIVGVAVRGSFMVVGIISAVIFAIVAVVQFVKMSKKKKYIKNKYTERLADANKVLETAVIERAALNNEVDAFFAEEDRDVLSLEIAEEGRNE
ncbi:MAG: hypothetical protein K2G42_07585 [Clostridia bacterium]|nr:hypothetical protein [Clostridia bacterium]